jgi:amino acid transporter
MLVFYGLGNIFGAGIYVLVGKIAGIAGIYAPLSFIVACIVVFLPL